jgi:hypothetical protein
VRTCHVGRSEETVRCVHKSVRMPLRTRAVCTGWEKHPPRLALWALPHWQAPGHCFLVRYRTSFELHPLTLRAWSGEQSRMGASHGIVDHVGVKRDAVSRLYSLECEWVSCLAKHPVVSGSMIRGYMLPVGWGASQMHASWKEMKSHRVAIEDSSVSGR